MKHVISIESVADFSLISIIENKWQMQLVRCGAICVFLFNGKCPSRRALRVYAKKFI